MKRSFGTTNCQSLLKHCQSPVNINIKEKGRKPLEDLFCLIMNLAAKMTNMEMAVFPPFYYNTFPNITICRHDTNLGADEKFLVMTEFFPNYPFSFLKHERSLNQYMPIYRLY